MDFVFAAAYQVEEGEGFDDFSDHGKTEYSVMSRLSIFTIYINLRAYVHGRHLKTAWY